MRYTLTQKLVVQIVFPTFKRFKSSTMSVFTQTKNPITGASEWDIQHEDYDYHQEIARSAFADMLHDTERNKKYQKALHLAIKNMHDAGKKANVLDIGTGTGLLSIMAAKSGADSIVACEAFKPMAECCLKILRKNNVHNKITVIPKRSTELTVGENGDLKQKANILVTEVFDTELIGEGALSTFTHAHKNLLEEDCIVVPDSAVVYAQVVECPTLQKWNKLNDVYDEDLELILRTPAKMKECAGSAAVHDLQLSQLPRSMFRELSDPIPVFHYDWSGKTPLEFDRIVNQTVKVTASGKAQMVFMWWELSMDTEGKIPLSCAPWWAHPSADTCADRPQDSIPWRDHWMQAVYYLPQETPLLKDKEVTLISCQDEYSLWFYLEQEQKSMDSVYKRPICECGVHMAYSRTHVSYLNDGKRSKKLLRQLKDVLHKNAIVLDLNGSSLLGLAAAKLSAKKVYIHESMNLNINILKDYAKTNAIDNVEYITVQDVPKDILKEVTHVICDPNFSSAILPWDNLKFAYFLHKYKQFLRKDVVVVPESCSFYVMPVEFRDLHKIRVPLNKCEGIDMTLFDKLVESSRSISDDEMEAQPLWEYPCYSRGRPNKIIDIDFTQLQTTYSTSDIRTFNDLPSNSSHRMNGFVSWAEFSVGGRVMSGGATADHHSLTETVLWDTHTRQAVRILKSPRAVTSKDRFSYQVTCDLEKGQFNVNLDVITE